MISALNGPPGTGKTTVLQSVIATLVVDSVLENKKNPPIIFGVSATNQAKNNIIGGFKISQLDIKKDDFLENRWIQENIDNSFIFNNLDYGISLKEEKDKEKTLDMFEKYFLNNFSENDAISYYQQSYFNFINENNIKKYSEKFNLLNIILNAPYQLNFSDNVNNIDDITISLKNEINSLYNYLNSVEKKKKI